MQSFAMNCSDCLSRLHAHQRHALDVLFRGAEALDGGGDMLARRRSGLRAELDAVLQAYQVFKHEEVFDPAVASGGVEQARLARAMKIECIGAGEVFRSHRQHWTDAAIVADPANYKVSARLTLNALRRHIEREGEGITLLLAMLARDIPRAA